MRILIAFTMAALLAYAGDKRMTVEDSLAIRTLDRLQFSPSGKWIAFTASEWDRKQNRRVSHVYVVSPAGGAPIRLTSGEKGETSPEWSPDSSRIAFLADRSVPDRNAAPEPAGESERRRAQIWMIGVGGGEAEKLTDEEEGVTELAWSPDGQSIAYVTRDGHADKADRDRRKKEKFDAIVVDRELRYSHLWKISLATKEKKRLTRGAFSVSAPRWSPDGKWIAYVQSATAAQDSRFTDISEDRNSDIYVAPAEGGAARRVTTNPGADTDPQWSPDGREIGYVARLDPRSWAVKSEIMVTTPDGGAPRSLTPDFHESAGANLTWSHDGKSLLFTSGAGVHTQLFRVGASGGRVAQITEGARSYSQFDVSRDGRLAFALATREAPADLWVSTIGKGDERRLTTLNPQLAEFAVSASEVVKWKGADGLDVEGVLVKPLPFDGRKKYPLILQIHGGPYGRFEGSFTARAQIFAGAGYAVLMPNPRGSTGYGQKFTLANVGDWGGKDFGDLMAGVDAMITRGVADPEKLVVMGGSYGGFMTFWTVTQTNRFKAAIGHAAISDWYSFHGQSDIPALMEYGFLGQPWTAAETYRKYSPMTYVSNVKTPLLVTHGEQDRRVPIAQSEQYYRALRKRGVEVVFVRYPREGHGIQEPNHQIDLVKRQLDWFDSHLGITR